VFSNTLSPCSSLNVRDQVWHPYRTKGKIIVLYILIFKFFDSRREDRRGKLNSTQPNSVAWVRERTIPTERPPLVDEVSANFLNR
jgi:hypothetical protein